jgi:pimeloyl-ACP methyl ester carboxylesterase/DNA-binding CsgD family transcriptional regulator
MDAPIESFTSGASGADPEELAVLAWAGLEVTDLDPSAESRGIFSAQGVTAAVFGRDGSLVAATPRFAIDSVIGAELIAETRRRRRAWTTDAILSEGEEPTRLALAPIERAGSWALPGDLAAAARTLSGGVVVLAAHAGEGPLTVACLAYGLTGLQTRLAIESIRSGSIRAAAERLGVAHDTAREALANALKRTGAPRLPALVSRLTSLAFGVLPGGSQQALLDEVWGLSSRQAQIAGLVAEGLPRRAIAEALGLSEAVVKKELDRVYAIVGAPSAAGLSRRIAEARALSAMTRATRGEIGLLEHGLEPLRFVARADGSRIAISDYGPASGAPVLVAHSSMTSRVVSRGLLRALQAAGFRPVAIDRPGFGLSDPVAGARAGAHDPYATAADDALRVLDQLRLRRVDLVARGGAQFVAALARRAPERLGRVVLVNPDPPSTASGQGRGPLGRFKDAYRQNPTVIRLAISLLSRHFTLERLAEALPRWMRGSPPDEAAVRDPELVRDYFRAMRMFATGRYEGYVNEQVEFARGADTPPLPDASRFRVLVAAHDTLHDPDRTERYWASRLPGAQFRRITEAGRFLAMSHPHLVVEALTGP